MKIKVRIALAANREGEWSAYGYRGHDDWGSIMDTFERMDGEQRFWIEAEIDVPDEIPAIQAGAIKTAD